MTLPYFLFALSNFLILPFWAGMILAPAADVTRRLLKGHWIFVALAVLYGTLVLPKALDLLPLLVDPDLDQIRGLLGSPWGAAAAWLHFLTFDLFVGRWIWQDALAAGRSRWGLRFVLFWTLMLGPLGLLLYLAWVRVDWPPSRKSLLLLAALCPWLLLLCLVGLAWDSRVITALPAWAKPLKFVLSILAYSLTLEAILRRLKFSLWADRLRLVTSLCLSLELLIIFAQAGRGTTSHFNLSTPLDAGLFFLMGCCVVPVWLGLLVVIALLARSPSFEPALKVALLWGAGIAFVGLGWGWVMVKQGAHTIGAPDGGTGLPLLGWSTVAGDLRVAHFLGFHALQLLPLVWLVTPQKMLIHLQGLLFLVLVNWQAYQALKGFTAFRWEPVTVLLIATSGLLIWAGRRYCVPGIPSTLRPR